MVVEQNFDLPIVVDFVVQLAIVDWVDLVMVIVAVEYCIKFTLALPSNA